MYIVCEGKDDVYKFVLLAGKAFCAPGLGGKKLGNAGSGVNHMLSNLNKTVIQLVCKQLNNILYLWIQWFSCSLQTGRW